MTAFPLNSLCQVKHGGTPSKSIRAFWQGNIPWVSPKDMKASVLLDASDHITEEAIINSATSLVPEGTILVVARSGILAHSLPVARAGRPLAFNQDIKALLPDCTKVDPAYLYWFVRSSEKAVLTQGVKRGATVHSLQSGFLESLSVPLPSRREQRRIVDLLSRAEGIVRLRRVAQAKAQAIIPALFLDMFGDPATNPMGWSVVSLGDAIWSADYGSSTKASESGAGVPLIRMANVSYAGHLDFRSLKYVELEPAEEERFQLKRGDILFNRTNSKELVGKTGLWDTDLHAVAASYFIRLRVDEAKLLPFYVWAFMNTNYMKRVLFGTARGAIGQANINSRELRSFSVPLSPLNTQARFEEQGRAVLGIVAQQSEALRKAEAVFHSVLARAFSSDLTATAPEGVAAAWAL